MLSGPKLRAVARLVTKICNRFHRNESTAALTAFFVTILATLLSAKIDAIRKHFAPPFLPSFSNAAGLMIVANIMRGILENCCGTRLTTVDREP